MRAGELKAALAQYPDDMPVVCSRDSEGNGHSPSSNVSDGRYEPESDWHGNVRAEDDEADAGDEAYRAVVLWPLN